MASGVSGVVTRDAKGSSQGMITITDGNNLDMPAEVKFPKVSGEENRIASLLLRSSLVLRCPLPFSPPIVMVQKVNLQTPKGEVVGACPRAQDRHHTERHSRDRSPPLVNGPDRGASTRFR